MVHVKIIKFNILINNITDNQTFIYIVSAATSSYVKIKYK